jgi:hypothetical protein
MWWTPCIGKKQMSLRVVLFYCGKQYNVMDTRYREEKDVASSCIDLLWEQDNVMNTLYREETDVASSCIDLLLQLNYKSYCEASSPGKQSDTQSNCRRYNMYWFVHQGPYRPITALHSIEKNINSVSEVPTYFALPTYLLSVTLASEEIIEFHKNKSRFS